MQSTSEENRINLSLKMTFLYHYTYWLFKLFIVKSTPLFSNQVYPLQNLICPMLWTDFMYLNICSNLCLLIPIIHNLISFLPLVLCWHLWHLCFFFTKHDYFLSCFYTRSCDFFRICNIQLTLELHRFEPHGSIDMQTFFSSKATWSTLGWICGCETLDDKRDTVQRADRKLHTVSTGWGSAPQPLCCTKVSCT